MAVLELAAKSNKDMREALEYMLYEVEHGDITGFTGTFSRPNGQEEGLSTGRYKARPELALRAIMRMSRILLDDEDDEGET